jgi:hypothetical protein
LRATSTRIVAAGLLDINVLARLHREDRHGRVPVVRSGNEQRVDVLVLEHAAKIRLRLRRAALPLLGVRGRPGQGARIDVDHVFELNAGDGGKLVDEFGAAAAAAGRTGAHAGDSQHELVGRRLGGPQDTAGGEGRDRTGGQGRGDELAAGELRCHGIHGVGFQQSGNPFIPDYGTVDKLKNPLASGSGRLRNTEPPQPAQPNHSAAGRSKNSSIFTPSAPSSPAFALG